MPQWMPEECQCTFEFKVFDGYERFVRLIKRCPEHKSFPLPDENLYGMVWNKQFELNQRRMAEQAAFDAAERDEKDGV